MSRVLRPVEAVEGETVDQLVWREVGRGSPVVERVMEANPGLSDSGLFLKHGQVVLIPADADRAAPAAMTQLWT